MVMKGSCMSRRTVELADAKAHSSELADRAERGEEIVITKRGRSVAVLAPFRRAKQPIDVAAARAFLATLPRQTERAAELVRRMRDEARYRAPTWTPVS
jgi:prevent-host-death family protein